MKEHAVYILGCRSPLGPLRGVGITNGRVRWVNGRGYLLYLSFVELTEQKARLKLDVTDVAVNNG